MFPRSSTTHNAGTALLVVLAAACGNARGGESGETETPETPETSEYGATETMTSVTVPAGTELRLALQTELSTKDNEAGDRFTATVVQPIVREGHTAIPAGAVVQGRVTAVQAPSGEMPAVLKIDFDRIDAFGESYPLGATLTQADVKSRSDRSTAEDAATIGVTTVAGAVIGRVIGGNSTGTLIGAAVGGAAGTAIVLGDKDDVAALEEGSELTIRLTESLRVDIDH